MDTFKLNKRYITHQREPFFEVVKKYLTPNSKLLDIGAGNGCFSRYFKRKDFYLMDGNEKSVALLKSEFSNVFHSNLPKLPFEDDFFDIIHCSHVIEHLTPDILYATLIEMNRCLTKNGKLIISAPLMWEGFYNDLSHIKPYNPKILIYYLINSNKNSTRESISENYKLKELIYRYRVKDIDWIYYKNPIYRFIQRVLSRFSRKYEKTGYTIVFEK